MSSSIQHHLSTMAFNTSTTTPVFGGNTFSQPFTFSPSPPQPATPPAFWSTSTQAPQALTQPTADKGQIVQCLNESKNVQIAILNELKQLNESMKHTHTPQNQTLKPTHTGVFCNVCNKQNITGFRYKCLFCKDFDMCEDCEAKTNFHDTTHSFIKIKDTNTFNAKIQMNTPLFNA